MRLKIQCNTVKFTFFVANKLFAFLLSSQRYSNPYRLYTVVATRFLIPECCILYIYKYNFIHRRGTLSWQIEK